MAQAAEAWIAYVKLERRQRSTWAQYEQHARHHINPRLGSKKLSSLTAPMLNAFRDDLLATMKTRKGLPARAMPRKVLTSLKSLLKDAQRRGTVAQNVALSVKIGVDKRDRRKLKVGVDIPTSAEISAMLNVAKSDRQRAFLMTAIFTGLRASELRGLPWSAVDPEEGQTNRQPES